MKKYFIGKSCGQYFLAEKIGASYWAIPEFSNGNASDMTFYSQKNSIFYDDFEEAVKKLMSLNSEECEKQTVGFKPDKNYFMGVKTEAGWVRSV